MTSRRLTRSPSLPRSRRRDGAAWPGAFASWTTVPRPIPTSQARRQARRQASLKHARARGARARPGGQAAPPSELRGGVSPVVSRRRGGGAPGLGCREESSRGEQVGEWAPPQSRRSGFAAPPPRVLLVSPPAVPLPSDAWPVGGRLFHAAEIGVTRFPLFGRDQQNIVLDRRGRAQRPEVEQLHG